MPKVAYVHGRYVPVRDADISMMDRSAQFGDGVYEAVLLQNGKFFDAEPHIERLWRSMKEMHINPPCSQAVLRHIMNELVRRNRAKEGGIYVQVSRGVSMRKHEFDEDMPSFLTAFMLPSKARAKEQWLEGYSAIYADDERWARCDIKSVCLIPNVMARQAAKKAGAAEALFVSKENIVREGSLSNLFIVRQDGVLQTHPLTAEILPGITRARIMQLAVEMGVSVEERPFSVSEYESAKEAFVSSSIAKIVPLVKTENAVIGQGKTGELTVRLSEAYEQAILTQQEASVS